MAQTADYRLTDLVSRVDQDRLVIPDFQRGFKWRASDIRKLLESLLLNYPIGAALFWRTQRSSLAFRRVEDVELGDPDDGEESNSDHSAGNMTEEIDFILDGQQRITSIYKLFPKRLEPSDIELQHRLRGLRFFLDLKSLGLPTELSQLSLSEFSEYSDPDRVAGAIIERAHAELKRDYRSAKNEKPPARLTTAHIIDICTRNLWLPLTRDFLDNKLAIVYRLRAEAQHRLTQMGEASNAIGSPAETRTKIDESLDRWMDWFTSTFVSKLNSKTIAVLLVHNEPPEGLARIFETINSTGMTLSVFDLLVARLGAWSDENGVMTNLRKIIQDSIPRTYLRKFDDERSLGGTATQQIPRAFALKAGVELKKGEILRAGKERFLAFKAEIAGSLQFALETLSLRMGVIDEKLLPFRDCISLLAGFHRQGVTASQVDSAIALLWTASVVEDWDNSTNEKTRAWFLKMRGVLDGSVEPLSILAMFDERFPSFEDVRDAASNSILYRTLLAFNLSLGGVDWTLEARHSAGDLEDHHLFPKDWLTNNQSPDTDKATWITLRDCVLNRILVTKDANRSAKALVPPNYLNKLSAQQRRLIQIPDSFLGPLPTPIPYESFNSYLRDRYILMKADLRARIESNLQM